MNYELLKSRMNKFFEETSAEELVSHFERMGYAFVDVKCVQNDYNNYKVIIHGPPMPRSFMDRLLLRKAALPKNMTSNFSGSFFLLKIAI